jgi:hypothetical protein
VPGSKQLSVFTICLGFSDTTCVLGVAGADRVTGTGRGTSVDCKAFGGVVSCGEVLMILAGSPLLPIPSELCIAGGDIG